MTTDEAYDTEDTDTTWLFGVDALDAAYGPLAPTAARYVRDMSTFIAQTCNAAKLPLLLCATSTLHCMRVFTVRPLDDPSRHAVATACILLAVEVDEYMHVANDTIVTAAWDTYMATPMENATPVDHAAFGRLVRSLIYVVFGQLKWTSRVKHPYVYLPLAVEDMRDPVTRHAVLREAWLLVNESYHTNALLRFRPSIVACAAVAIAAGSIGHAPSPGTLARWAKAFDCSPTLLADAREVLRPLVSGSL